MEKAVLLDLGGVVLDIDFHRVFASWAKDSGVDKSLFYDQWSLDDAYKQHEVGALSFQEYSAHLSRSLGVSMSDACWQKGWNALWVGVYGSVIALLPQLAQQYTLCAFSNTNATHAASFKHHFGTELSHFETLYLSQEVGQRKPDTQAFLTVCERMGYAPKDVVFLDDSQENVTGGKAAGLEAYLTRGDAQVASQLKTLLEQRV